MKGGEGLEGEGLINGGRDGEMEGWREGESER